jgi:hypothetical protein
MLAIGSWWLACSAVTSETTGMAKLYGVNGLRPDPSRRADGLTQTRSTP